jgi:hypothetical protein
MRPEYRRLEFLPLPGDGFHPSEGSHDVVLDDRRLPIHELNETVAAGSGSRAQAWSCSCGPGLFTKPLELRKKMTAVSAKETSLGKEGLCAIFRIAVQRQQPWSCAGTNAPVARGCGAAPAMLDAVIRSEDVREPEAGQEARDPAVARHGRRTSTRSRSTASSGMPCEARCPRWAGSCGR